MHLHVFERCSASNVPYFSVQWTRAAAQCFHLDALPRPPHTDRQTGLVLWSRSGPSDQGHKFHMVPLAAVPNSYPARMP